MSTGKGAAHRIDGGDDQVGSGSSVPKRSHKTVTARLGCLLGCAGFGHDEGCTLGGAVTTTRNSCRLGYVCRSKGIESLTSPAAPTFCPCGPDPIGGDV